MRTRGIILFVLLLIVIVFGELYGVKLDSVGVGGGICAFSDSIGPLVSIAFNTFLFNTINNEKIGSDIYANIKLTWNFAKNNNIVLSIISLHLSPSLNINYIELNKKLFGNSRTLAFNLGFSLIPSLFWITYKGSSINMFNMGIGFPFSLYFYLGAVYNVLEKMTVNITFYPQMYFNKMTIIFTTLDIGIGYSL